MANHFPLVIDAEQKNFDQGLKLLGETARLVSDLDDLYKALGATARFPSKASEEMQLAFHSTVRITTICQRELTMGALTLLRGHRDDCLAHLRAAIDAAAAVWRISRHPELAKVWLEGGTDAPGDTSQPKYKAYQKKFGARELYPEAGKPDHNPSLARLYGHYGVSSKIIHVSIFRVAGHMGKSKGEGMGVAWTFLDISSGKDMVSALFTILHGHLDILSVLGDSLEGKGPERNAWKAKVSEVGQRIERHRLRWVSRYPK